MAIKIFYTHIAKERYKDASGTIPNDLVTVADGRCAARVTLQEVPGEPNMAYAELPAVMEGRVTSVSVRLVDKVPTGQAVLTTVSPELDINGAFMYSFIDEILPTTVGPPMYRRTCIRNGYYCTDKMNRPQKIYLIIVGGTGLVGTAADVAMIADTH